MDSGIDIRANLNAQDDDGLGWSTLAEAVDAASRTIRRSARSLTLRWRAVHIVRSAVAGVAVRRQAARAPIPTKLTGGAAVANFERGAGHAGFLIVRARHDHRTRPLRCHAKTAASPSSGQRQNSALTWCFSRGSPLSPQSVLSSVDTARGDGLFVIAGTRCPGADRTSVRGGDRRTWGDGERAPRPDRD